MQKETKQVFWVGSIALSLFLLGSPYISSHAQKESEAQKVENQVRDEQSSLARAAVAKSVVGSLLLDTLLVKERSWSLDKAGFFERTENNTFTYLSMSLKQGDKYVGIGILECDSPKDADEHFGGPRSYGASVPFNKYGDKGDKLIGSNGDLMAIRFRKDNFFVTIWNRDQKTAERLAEYALNSLGSVVSK